MYVYLFNRNIFYTNIYYKITTGVVSRKKKKERRNILDNKT